MSENKLLKATVSIPGGLHVSLESHNTDDLMKMLEAVIRQFPGTRISRQGKHVYNAVVEQEILKFADVMPDGFLVSDLRKELGRAEPLVRMALERCVQNKSIVLVSDKFRVGRFGRFTKLYRHAKFEKGK